MNKPKTKDNREVCERLWSYPRFSDLCEVVPTADDVFSAVLAAKTAGDSSTRSLSRKVLFHVLQACPVISAAAVADATRGIYSERTCRAYAAAAGVASVALRRLFERIDQNGNLY